MTNEHEASHLTRGQWIFYGFLAFIGFLLFTEHRAHVLGDLTGGFCGSHLGTNDVSLLLG